MAIHEIDVRYKYRDVEGEGLRAEVQRTLGFDTGEIRTSKKYFIEGTSEDDARVLGERLLADRVIEIFSVNEDENVEDARKKVTKAYQPGVMDPDGEEIKKSAGILGIHPEAVATATEYSLSPNVTEEQIEEIKKRLLINPTVQQDLKEKPETLIISGEPEPVKAIPIRFMSEEDLIELSEREKLGLNLEEMKTMQGHAIELGRDFTNVEVGVFGQTWSDHNKHKSTNADIHIDGVKKPSVMNRIRGASLMFPEKFRRAFEGNAGMVDFYDGFVITAKGETHNWPVSVEPEGGAQTRSGGLFRDHEAEGAQNLFSFDINCFAPPDMPMDLVPEGRHHPDYIFRHNFYGIRDYGNRMGIPTVRSENLFHQDFRGNVVSLGVSFGIMPEERVNTPEPGVGDLVISIGGRTGRDGILGTNMSSMQSTSETITVGATSVQIGNAIEEKRVFDAMEECRRENLYKKCNDVGGGGYSAAIGELGEKLGVELDLDQIKTKYQGLSPIEKVLSESQERMVFAADEENLERMGQIFEKHGVEMSVLGRFTGEGKFTMKNKGEIVCDLDMEFLHHGLPKKRLDGHWTPPEADERKPDIPTDWTEAYKKVLGHWNVCSVEPIVRQYDHGVKGITALAPYTGVNQDVLNDGYVAKPIYGKPYGLVATHSLNPTLNRINPYEGVKWTAADAFTKFTAVGGDYKRAALIDNYIWPKLDTEQNVASIDMATDALCDSVVETESPCVSGKDSVSSTFVTNKGERIDIPPVLNITVFGGIPDVEKTQSLDFKKTNSTICLVGNMDKENLAGSVYYDTCGLVGTSIPKADLQNLPPILDKVLEGIQSGKIRASHAISKGGLAASLAQMCFGGDCGAKIDLSTLGDTRPDFLFFNETSGTLLVEIDNTEVAEQLLDGIPYAVLGRTQEKKSIDVEYQNTRLFSSDTNELKKAYQEPMKGVIGCS